MKKLTLAAASALTLALAMPLVAQAGGHKGGGPQLEKLDTNADVLSPAPRPKPPF